MLSLHGRPTSVCDGISRRELMRIGGLNLLGLSLPALLSSQAQAASQPVGDPTFGRAKNVIFLWLQGGPPQHETWDPKPLAPLEIRGDIKPISTNVPGIQISELLPRCARMADKLAIVRSMSTDENTHENSGYWVLTGYRNSVGIAREIKPTDWPYFGSIVKMLKPSEIVPALSTVWVPDVIRLNDNVRPGGQTGGFLGSQWDPDYFVGDPSAGDYQIQGLRLQPEITPLRLSERMSLSKQVGQHLDHVERSGVVRTFDEIRQAAFGLLTSGKAREAFAVQKEPLRVREQFGLNRWGQCVLLARRLIEAGVRMVHVNWPRDPGDSAIDNPMWDTHSQNADRLQDVLCPQFDVGFSALLTDLEQRGLLDETLVVAIGEFGRTPKINSFGGRDHWGGVFSFVMAGAGIRGGQVYGSSDRNGAYPAANRVQPPDFTATIFHLLGIGHEATFPDRAGRPLHVTKGDPLHQLLGTQPATTQRTTPGGDIASVPPFDDSLLRNVDFEQQVTLNLHGGGPRVKGWQGSPLAGLEETSDFGAALIHRAPAGPGSERSFGALGFGIGAGKSAIRIPQGAVAMLSQEVRNPRVGRFTFTVRACGRGESADFYREMLLRHFSCRLLIFGFQDVHKDHRQHRQFSTSELQPSWTPLVAGNLDTYKTTATLKSQDDEAMQLSKGIGVAIVLEKTSPGVLELPAGRQAFIAIDEVSLTFDPRPRDDNVTI